MTVVQKPCQSPLANIRVPGRQNGKLLCGIERRGNCLFPHLRFEHKLESNKCVIAAAR